MKKIIISISFFAGCVIALMNFTETSKLDYLLEANIEALAQMEPAVGCIAEGGNVDMASVCQDGGIVQVTCEIAGKITVFGVTIEGSYKKGQVEYIAWARYACVASTGNCCKKQGIYMDETKLA